MRRGTHFLAGMEEFESNYCARENLLNVECWITARPQQVFNRGEGSRSWMSLPRLSMEDSTKSFASGDRRPLWRFLPAANRKSLQASSGTITSPFDGTRAKSTADDRHDERRPLTKILIVHAAAVTEWCGCVLAYLK